LDTIDERRRGFITTSQAAIQLVKLLPDTASAHALDRYTEKLDEIDHLHADACGRGRAHLTFKSDPICGKSGNTTHEHSDGREPGEIDDEADEPSINENTDGEQLTRDLNPRKRGPDESLYAFNHPTIIHPPIDPKLELTLKLKNNYAIDLKASKCAVLGFPRCPLFPDSQWNDVLLDRYVDFDKILTGYYALESDHRETQTIGGLDISINTGGSSGKPVKEICIYGEWTIAYARYTRAVLFVYPHRSRELEEYQEYMAGQFAAYPDVSDQYKIINFDKAICLRVGQSNDLLLTDYARFQDIISYHLINPKTSRPSEAKRPKLSSNDETPICCRWNNGHCVSITCGYRHECHHCHGKHQAKDCTSGQQDRKKN